MTRRRIFNVLNKEWALLFKDLNNSLMVTALPILIVGQGLLDIWLIQKFGAPFFLESGYMQNILRNFAVHIPDANLFGTLDLLRLFLLNQFNFWILLIPTMIAVNFATFSIIEEKQTNSLEPLLATPVRTWELLFGKALAGAIPSLIMTWVSGGVFLVAVILMGWGDLLPFLMNLNWFVNIILMTAVITVLSFMLGTIASSKAKDARSAQQISVVVIFPVFALIGIQVSGLLYFTPALTLALAILVALVDYALLGIAVKLFQRESILVRWR